jgi:hypothetical protein
MGTRGAAMILDDFNKELTAFSCQLEDKLKCWNNAGNFETAIYDLKSQGAHPSADARPLISASAGKRSS